MELCNKREVIAGNTWFEKKLIHKYTWVREGGVERSMIDLILIEELMRKILIDVAVRRGLAGGKSDHFLVECKVQQYVGKKYVDRGRCITEIVRVSELEKRD